VHLYVNHDATDWLLLHACILHLMLIRSRAGNFTDRFQRKEEEGEQTKSTRWTLVEL
jgi:hypothetical protein